MTTSARRLRSLLFAPASRPEVCEKLPRSKPDGVVIDLEDAVPAEGKADARGHARRVGEQLAGENPAIAVYVRVNAVPSEWFERDVQEALSPGLAGIVVPKLESAEQVDTVGRALVDAGWPDLHVVGGIETAAGVAYADAVMRPPVAVAYFGAEDFISDMGGVRTESNTEVLYARSRVALAARLAGVHALDQIVADIDDEPRFRADARQARSIGYRGKLCIHPRQVPLANEVFSPSTDDITRARSLLSLYEAAQAEGQQVIVFEGQMIDEALARRARDLLAADDL